MSKSQRKAAKGKTWRRKAYWQMMKYNRVRRSGGKGCRYAPRGG